VCFGRSVLPTHCGVMAAWSRKTLKVVYEFLRFLEKRPLTLKFSTKVFTPYRSTLLWLNFVKFCRREIGKIVRYLPDKKFWLPLKLSLMPGSRPKSARTNPRQCTRRTRYFIQTGSLLAELFPNAWTPPNCRV